MPDNDQRKKRESKKDEEFARLTRRAHWIARAIMVDDKEEIARRYAWAVIGNAQQSKIIKFYARKDEVMQELKRRSKVLNEKQAKEFQDCLDEIQSSQGSVTRNLDRIQKQMRKAQAIKAAKAALTNDKHGKQAGKVTARVMWNDWQTGKKTHKSAAAFARYVVNQISTIESTKTVERWSTAWARESAHE